MKLLRKLALWYVFAPNVPRLPVKWAKALLDFGLNQKGVESPLVK